jgi:hypothetical protein
VNCRICGAELPEGAMFCGECGSSTSATPESRRRVDPRPGDTTVIEGGVPLESGVISVPVEGYSGPVEADAPLQAEGAAAAGSVERAEQALNADADPDAAADDGTEDAGTGAAAGSEDAADADADAQRPAVPGEADATSSARSTGRFVLRFTTGETRTVFGTGLIGRRPMPQPGETYDHLVQIADRSLSVSKTHLEFGAHEDELWVADRFSANGTIVHRPDLGAVHCEPGRRYLVPRGSRVEMAEHSFRVE